MSWKKQETKRDRTNQEKVISFFCRQSGYTYKPLTDNYFVDYAVYDGNEIVGLVEVKCHTEPMEKFGKWASTICSLKKRANTVQYASSIGCEAWMLTRAPDGLWLTDLRMPHDKCKHIDAQGRDMHDSNGIKYDSEIHFFWRLNKAKQIWSPSK